MNNWSKITKPHSLLIVVMIVCGLYWIFDGMSNKLMSDKVNHHLLIGKSFLIKEYFPNVKMACALAPYYGQIQDIDKIQHYLNAQQITRLNRKINSQTDAHWNLLIINDNNYKVYRIRLKAYPNFKNYQCAFSQSNDWVEIYPILVEDERVRFGVR